MRRVFLRYFLSIFAIAVTVLLIQFGVLMFQYGVSQDQWKDKVYDDFIVSIEDVVNEGSLTDYGLNSILMVVSDIEDDRISGFILRDLSGNNVVAFGRTSEGRMLNSVFPVGQTIQADSKDSSTIKNATRINVASSYDPKTNILSFNSVAGVDYKNVEISMPAIYKNEGVVGSVIIAVDGQDAFIIDLLSYSPRTYKYSKDIINSCIRGLFISLPICLIIALVAAWIISSRNTRYINGVRKALNDLSRGKTDVSIPRQRNSELNEISIAIEDLDRNLKSNANSRKAWLYSISHDLNTPATAMKMIVDGLNDGVFPAETETFRELQKENDKLADRIGRVIDFSTLQADTKAIQEEVPCDRFIEEVLSGMGPDCKVSAASECQSITCDEKLMARAVTELLRNAAEAEPDPSALIRWTIREKDGFNEMQIVNVGTIPQEMDVDFFEPWARGDWSRTDGGSGLGLPIASTIVSLHKGTISITQLSSDLVSALVRWPRA